MIYDILSKTLTDPKPLCIRLRKIDGFTRIYDGTKYLTLFGSEKYETIYSKIRYLISLICAFRYIYPHYFAKTKVDSYNSLPIEKTMTLHYVIILIKSVPRKDKNIYCYNIFLEKCSYQLAKR